MQASRCSPSAWTVMVKFAPACSTLWVTLSHGPGHRADIPIAAAEPHRPDGLALGGSEIVGHPAVGLVRIPGDVQVDVREPDHPGSFADLEGGRVVDQVTRDLPPALARPDHGRAHPLGTFRFVKGPQRDFVGLGHRANRQYDGTGSGLDAQSGRLRRRPCQRPVRSRDGEPNAVPCRKGLCATVQRKPHLVARVGFEWLWLLVPVSVREVEQPVGHPGRAPVRLDVRQPGGELADRERRLQVVPRRGWR